MRLTDIALANLRRRRARALFSVAGLLLGTATMVALTSITAAMKADLAVKLDQYGANIVVTPRTNGLALSYGGVTVGGVTYDVKDLPADAADRIRTIKNRESISTVAPKLLGAVRVEGAAQPVLLVGVDFPSEFRMKKWWEVTGSRPAQPNEVILGATLAQKLGKRPGDGLTLNGESFRVSGVLHELGGQEDGLVFGDLKVAQRLLRQPDRISLIEVSALCSTCPIEEIVAQINGALPTARAVALKQAVRNREETVNRLNRFSVAVGAVVLLIGTLVVLTTMMSSVNERTREIGIFRAVGFRRRHIVRLILMESLVISLSGGIFGYIAGILVARLAAPLMAGGQVPIGWNPLLGLAAVASAAVVGLAASAYPAHRAAQLDPAEALRFI
ncbi:MAG: ABC transporter permease [Betaproteobacteria bacterium]